MHPWLRYWLVPIAGVVVAALLLAINETAGYLAFGVVAIALPAWFPMEASRVVGAILLGALVCIFVRVTQGTGLGILAGLVAAAVAWYVVPSRVLRRFTFLVPSMVTLIFVVALLMFNAPGSPFATEKVASDQVQAQQYAKWGLSSDPTPTEFFRVYMGKILNDFDFGPSLTVQGRSVMELLGPAFPVSMALGLLALIIAAGLGLALGIRAGLKPNSFADYSSMGLAVVGISLPNFVIGACLILVFALKLEWLPVARWGSYGHLVMPAITLALPYAAYIARLARGGTIEVMQQDFIRTARAKGLSERVVVTKHALKGALLPVVSFLGPAAAGIMTGSFVVETLFGIPGMGQWFVRGAINRDYWVVLGTAVIYFSIIIALNLLVDLAYAVLDPRVREDL